MSVTLIEASDHILGTFDRRLVEYVSALFAKRRIRVLTGTSVARVEKNVCFLKVGRPCDAMRLWLSCIVAAAVEHRFPPHTHTQTYPGRHAHALRPLRVEHGRQGHPPRGGPGRPGAEGCVRSHGRERQVDVSSVLSSPPKALTRHRPHTYVHTHRTGRGGRILVDSHLRVVGHAHQGVWALGDCAVSQDRPLPPLAQAAQQVRRWRMMIFCVGFGFGAVGRFGLIRAISDRPSSGSTSFCLPQQAKYLAGVFNKYPEPHENLDAPSFQYKHLGA